MALMSTTERKRTERPVEHMKYTELTTERDFSARFDHGLLLEQQSGIERSPSGDGLHHHYDRRAKRLG